MTGKVDFSKPFLRRTKRVRKLETNSTTALVKRSPWSVSQIAGRASNAGEKIGPASSTFLTVLRSDLLLCTGLASLLDYRESEKKRSIDLAWHSDCGPERGQEKIRFITSPRCTKTSRKRIESTMTWAYFVSFLSIVLITLSFVT